MESNQNSFSLKGRRFKPTLWPTLFTIPALAVLIGLGAWQMERLAWKGELITEFETRTTAAPISPPNHIADFAKDRYKRVEAAGVFLNGKEILRTGQSYEGNVGFHVFVPFVVENGPTVFVNRGWIPEKMKDPKTRPENSQIKGQTTIDGFIRQSGLRGSFVPDNEPENGIWLYVDTAQMAGHVGIEEVPNYYIDQFKAEGNRLPIGADREVKVRNDHLQYAITWFSFALTLMVIYVLFHFKPEDDDG